LDQRTITDPDGSRPAAVAGVRGSAARRRWAVAGPGLAVALSYLAAARALYGGFAWFPRQQIPLSPSSDEVQQTWFLGWEAHAVSHLADPFFTTALNFPHGVNLLANTAMPLLGWLGAPITWAFGPLATYVVLLELGFAASALSAALCARRLGAGWWASWFVGAAFGFGAHRLVNGAIHVFLAVDVVLPWVLFAAIRLAQRRWGARRFGLVVGVLLSVEYLVSSERMGIEVLALAVVLVVDLAARRSRARLLELARAYGLAVAVAVVLLAVPLWYFEFGPQSITGAPHEGASVVGLSLRAMVQPGPWAWWAPLGRLSSGPQFLQAPWYPDGYFGAPILALAVVGALRRWRDPLVRGAVGLGVLFAALAVGPSLVIPGVHLSIWSPYRLAVKLPLIQDVLPDRYLEVVVLVVAWLAAQAFVGVRPRAVSVRARVYAALAVTLGAASVLSLAPAHQVAAVATGTPRWLDSAAARHALPEGTGVLTYPYAVTLFDSAMLDQAQSGLWYDLVGGQAIVPGPSGHNSGVRPLEPTVVFDALYRASQFDSSAPVTAFRFPVGPLPSLDARTAAQFRRFARRQHISEVLWRRYGYHPELALAYLSAAFGPGRAYANGAVRVWRISRGSPRGLRSP
jgi:dolichyl-phosphate beta-glucosyltransferase